MIDWPLSWLIVLPATIVFFLVPVVPCLIALALAHALRRRSISSESPDPTQGVQETPLGQADSSNDVEKARFKSKGKGKARYLTSHRKMDGYGAPNSGKKRWTRQKSRSHSIDGTGFGRTGFDGTVSENRATSEDGTASEDRTASEDSDVYEDAQADAQVAIQSSLKAAVGALRAQEQRRSASTPPRMSTWLAPLGLAQIGMAVGACFFRRPRHQTVYHDYYKLQQPMMSSQSLPFPPFAAIGRRQESAPSAARPWTTYEIIGLAAGIFATVAAFCMVVMLIRSTCRAKLLKKKDQAGDDANTKSPTYKWMPGPVFRPKELHTNDVELETSPTAGEGRVEEPPSYNQVEDARGYSWSSWTMEPYRQGVPLPPAAVAWMARNRVEANP